MFAPDHYSVQRAIPCRFPASASQYIYNYCPYFNIVLSASTFVAFVFEPYAGNQVNSVRIGLEIAGGTVLNMEVTGPSRKSEMCVWKRD